MLLIINPLLFVLYETEFEQFNTYMIKWAWMINQQEMALENKNLLFCVNLAFCYKFWKKTLYIWNILIMTQFSLKTKIHYTFHAGLSPYTHHYYFIKQRNDYDHCLDVDSLQRKHISINFSKKTWYINKQSKKSRRTYLKL